MVAELKEDLTAGIASDEVLERVYLWLYDRCQNQGPLNAVMVEPSFCLNMHPCSGPAIICSRSFVLPDSCPLFILPGSLRCIYKSSGTFVVAVHPCTAFT